MPRTHNRNSRQVKGENMNILNTMRGRVQAKRQAKQITKLLKKHRCLVMVEREDDCSIIVEFDKCVPYLDTGNDEARLLVIGGGNEK